MGEAETFKRSLAGDSFNILVAAQRLGSTTGYITRLGDDPFVGYLMSTWRNEGIDVSEAKLVAGFNAVHFVSLLPGGDREFIYYRKGSAPSTMQPSDLDHDYIGEARLLHVSGIGQAISDSARATILKAVEVAKNRGVSVSYDPNYRHQLWTPEEAREGMEEVLPLRRLLSAQCAIRHGGVSGHLGPSRGHLTGSATRCGHRRGDLRRLRRGRGCRGRRVRSPGVHAGAGGGYDRCRRRLQRRLPPRDRTWHEPERRCDAGQHRRRTEGAGPRRSHHHAVWR